VATAVARQWEASGHDVECRLGDGEPAQIAGLTVGVPGIARWWHEQFRDLADRGAEYDLVWMHQPLSPSVPDASFWKRTLLTVHTTETAEYRLAREGIYPRRRLPYLWLTSRLERRFHRRLGSLGHSGPTYTVVAPHLRDELEALGVANAAHVTNGRPDPGTDGPPPSPNGASSARMSGGPIREDAGVPADAPLAFTIGSQTPQKRPVACAEGLSDTCRDIPDLHAVIAGDGPLHESVRRAATHPRVHVCGHVDEREKWEWYAAADLFVSVSAYEGLPMATLEALASGTPVVLSDIPAHRHILEEYDGCGELLDSGTAFANSIRRLAGRTVSPAIPSWKTVAQRYLDVHAGRDKSWT
jgi:glycosyltransferase involved in cell wall biosynthesis